MQLTNTFDGKSVIYKTRDDLRSMILLPFDGKINPFVTRNTFFAHMKLS